VKGILLDENVPCRLTFKPLLPTLAASEVCGEVVSDASVWEYAARNDCAILTKDGDFSDRILAGSPPPWVVHLRFGNLRRREFHELLARLWPRIEVLLRDHKLVRVYADRLEAVR
jgi:predicted nuclease of predicted toxin-antitoxin system